MKKIAFIGVGNMASAMIGGITSSGHTAWKDILLYNRHPEKAGRFAALGAVIADGIAEAVREAGLCSPCRQAAELSRSPSRNTRGR